MLPSTVLATIMGHRVLVTVVAAAVIHCIPLQPIAAQACPTPNVASQYDRFRDLTIVTLDRLGWIPMRSAGTCYYATNLVASLIYRGNGTPGPDAVVTFTFVLAFASPTLFSNSYARQVLVLIDDSERYTLGPAEVEPRGQDVTWLHVTVPADARAAFLRAQRLEMSIRGDEISFDPSQLALLRRFLSP